MTWVLPNFKKLTIFNILRIFQVFFHLTNYRFNDISNRHLRNAEWNTFNVSVDFFGFDVGAKFLLSQNLL